MNIAAENDAAFALANGLAITSVDQLGESAAVAHTLASMLAGETKSNKVIFVTGAHGCGKTTLVRCALASLGFHGNWYEASSLKTQDAWSEAVDKATKYGNVLQPAPKVLVIENIETPDDIAGLLGGALSARTPVVCICDAPIGKRTNPEIKRAAVELVIPAASRGYMKRQAQSCMKAVGFDLKARDAWAIADACAGNFRRMLSVVQLRSVGVQLHDAMRVTTSGDTGVALSESVSSVLYGGIGDDDARDLFMQHKTMMAPMLRENYLTALDAKGTPHAKGTGYSHVQRLRDACEIARGLCMHDAIMRACPNRYGCNDVSALTTAVTVARVLRRPDAELAHAVPRALPITFSKTLTKASVQQNNLKTVCTLRFQTGDPYVTFDTLQTVCAVCKALMATDAEAAKRLLSAYKLGRDDLARVIRTNRVAVGLKRTQ
jgi:energy-coupling factor transporter ATP-binding protein EcfA2